MKRFIQWLARVFNAEITKEVVVERTVEKVVVRYLPKDGVVAGNVTIEGNVVVTGSMRVTGSLDCKCITSENK